MTHFMFGTRGIYAAMQQMISDLNAQRFWWRRKDMNKFLHDGKPNPNYGKIQDTIVQGMLRPIQFFEYVYPEKSPTQPGNPNSPMTDNTPLILRSFDIEGPEHYAPKSIDWAVNFLRKKIGLEQIPTIDMKGEKMMIHQLGISVVPIGIKKDEFKIHDFGPAGTYEQEMI